MVIDTDTEKPRLYLLQWLKSDRALMMLFNDGTFQVTKKKNFSANSYTDIQEAASHSRRFNDCNICSNTHKLLLETYLFSHTNSWSY